MRTEHEIKVRRADIPFFFKSVEKVVQEWETKSEDDFVFIKVVIQDVPK